MKLRHRTYLAGLALVTLIALIMGGSAVVTINTLALDLNHRLMKAELESYVEQVERARQVLKDNGLDHVREYVARAKADLIAAFEREGEQNFSKLVILDNQGRTVFAKGQLGDGLLETPCLQTFLARSSGTADCTLGGEAQVVHFRHIPDWDWLMMTSLTSGELYSTSRDFVIKAVSIFVLVSALGWLLFVSLSQSLVHPVLRLARAARAIGEGRWEQIPSPASRDDEMGELEQSFTQMGASLREAYAELEARAESLRTANTLLSAEVNERTRIEQELRKATADFELILDSMPSMVIGVDRDCRVNHWNQAAEEQAGLPRNQAMGRPVQEVLPRLNDYVPAIRRAMDKDQPVRLDRQRFDDGSRQEDILIFPLRGGGRGGAVIRLDDVTRRVRMEELMVQTEKMMSVGGLAAGMAHELNNPLAGVLTGVQNLTRRLDATHPANLKALTESACPPEALTRYLEARKLHSIIETIRSAGVRAAEIIRSMLHFSRSSTGSHEPSDLVAILDQSVALAQNEYDPDKTVDFKKITIVRNYEADLPPVPCVQSEITQVLLNLLRNAAQAMGEKAPDEAVITLRLYRAGDGAVIEVADNGPGIPEEQRKRIFEPFFTTKPVGVGTGLGLSVSYFIITENHGGRFEVESQSAQGALFRITLPLAPRG